jgi:hypothetical protein
MTKNRTKKPAKNLMDSLNGDRLKAVLGGFGAGHSSDGHVDTADFGAGHSSDGHH